MLLTLLLFANADYLKHNYVVPSKLNGGSVGFVIDSNWRWVRKDNSNCFAGVWVGCSGPVECYKCIIEGVPAEDYISPYGVKSIDDVLELGYVTKGPYSTNYGSRLYMVKDDKYLNFDLYNKEFSFDIDVSDIPCGLNVAVYFVPLKPILDKGGAMYGTGYGDAQCAKDIQFLQGFANTNNTGSCARELDVWEGNRHANAFTVHNCKLDSLCKSPESCGDGDNRYNGLCDKDGADLNPQRSGITNLYGYASSFSIDTSKVFTVKTKFVVGGDKLKFINRTFVQDGKTVDGGFLSDDVIAVNKAKFTEKNYHKTLGGLSAFDLNGLNLVVSLWDDYSAKMAWLDGVYPPGSTKAGDRRGPCAADKRDPTYLRANYPNSKVKLSNFKLVNIENKPQPPVKNIKFDQFCSKYEIKCV